MDLRIGTWNMRTLYKASNLRALTQLDSYQLHIIAIQETKWMGNNIWDTKTLTILQSGKQNGKRVWSSIHST
jgi:exonuclease III